jgi:HPt (histidine-containing phosphotransfer) domain-containing protein
MKTSPKKLCVPAPQRAFNREAFLSRVNNDLDQVLDLITLFLEIYPDSLQRIEAAVKQQDAEAIRDAAHQLKGSLNYIHADAATDAAQKLEQIGRRQQTDQSPAAFDGLVRCIEALSRELHAFLAAAPGTRD